MKKTLPRRPRMEAPTDFASKVSAMFPDMPVADMDQYSVTGTVAGDMQEYNVPEEKVLSVLERLSAGDHALYANNPPTMVAVKDGVPTVWVDGEPNQDIPLPALVVIVLAENGGDFDPLMDQQQWMELGARVMGDELSAEVEGPAWEAIAQALGWREAPKAECRLSAGRRRRLKAEAGWDNAGGGEPGDFEFSQDDEGMSGADVVYYQGASDDPDLEGTLYYMAVDPTDSLGNDAEIQIGALMMGFEPDPDAMKNFRMTDRDAAVAYFDGLTGAKVPPEMVNRLLGTNTGSGKREAGDYWAVAKKIAKTYGVSVDAAEAIFYGGDAPGLADALDKLVAAGYPDDHTTYDEVKPFLDKAGVTREEYMSLPGMDDTLDGDDDLDEAGGTQREGKFTFDQRVPNTGATAVTYQRDDGSAVYLGVWDGNDPEAEPIELTDFSADGEPDVDNTAYYFAADIAKALSEFNARTGEEIPSAFALALSDRAANLRQEATQNSSRKPAVRRVSQSARSVVEAHQRNRPMKSNRLYRALSEALALTILRKNRGVRMVREDEMAADQFYVVVAPEGADSSEVKIDDGQIFVGPFGSPEAAQTAVGGDSVDVVDGNLEPVGSGGSDDLGADDIAGIASPDLPMEARKRIHSRIRENVLKRIQREATALDVDTTIGGGEELDDNGSGNLKDGGAPAVALQAAADAGKSHDLDVDTSNPPGDAPVSLSNPDRGAMDRGADLDLSGAGAGKGGASFEGVDRFALRKGNLVLVKENGRKIDRGNVLKVEGTIVTLEGDVSYDLTKHEIKKIA
jgi:hypothetical protein